MDFRWLKRDNFQLDFQWVGWLEAADAVYLTKTIRLIEVNWIKWLCIGSYGSNYLIDRGDVFLKYSFLYFLWEK